MIPFREYLVAAEQLGGKLVKVVGDWRIFKVRDEFVTVLVIDGQVLRDDLDDLLDRFSDD